MSKRPRLHLSNLCNLWIILILKGLAMIDKRTLFVNDNLFQDKTPVCNTGCSPQGKSGDEYESKK
jgi:hypothetical protein